MLVCPRVLYGLRSFDIVKEIYERHRLRPLIDSLRHTTNTELPIALLERGADPKSMTGLTHNILHDSWLRSYNKGETVLDLVRERIDHLRTYGHTRSAKPKLPLGLDECPYMEGTYQHWVVAWEIWFIKRSHREDVEKYEKARCKTRARNKASKSAMATVKEKISGLRKLEEMLVHKGAKTFAE